MCSVHVELMLKLVARVLRRSVLNETVERRVGAAVTTGAYMHMQ